MDKAILNAPVLVGYTGLTYTIIVLTQAIFSYEIDNYVEAMVAIFATSFFLPILSFLDVRVVLSLSLKTQQILYLVITGIELLAIASIYMHFVAGIKPKNIDLQGKVYIVTGSNTGCGFETAKEIVRMNGTVIMACRDTEKAKEAKSIIIKSTGCADSKIKVIKLDLCGFDSVRKFVKEFRELGWPLHCLINNAGVMMQDRNLTQDGFETVITANHLSHFLLTNLLLQDLEKTAGRVVVLTSSLHKSVSRFNFDDIMSEHSYSLFGTYSQSKLANVMFCVELQKRLSAANSKVTCNAVHPGVVRTDVTRNMPAFMRIANQLLAPIMTTFQKTPTQGSYCSLHVATSPSLQNRGGMYFHNSKPSLVGAGARIEADTKLLWDKSATLTGLNSSTGNTNRN